MNSVLPKISMLDKTELKKSRNGEVLDDNDETNSL